MIRYNAARTIALTMLLLAAAVPAAADPVDDYVRAQLKQRNLPGLSLAIVKDGRVIKTAGYGVASLELDAPATAATVYEIGSISKQFTANAILLLVEDGKPALDDLLSKYIDDIPPAWSGISIRHVLTHTAGLPDFDTGEIGFSYRREYTAREFIALLAKPQLAFAPGSQWRYTNAFPLLGIVCERASGQPFAEFVQTRIFKRLGLASARFKIPTDVVRNRADGYLFKDGRFHRGEPLRPQIIAPNGGILIDVADFARWDLAITEGRLLKPSSAAAMSTPVRLTDGRTVSHGLGWFMDTFAGHPFGAHWGTTVTGHSAVIRRYTDDRLTVIVMANVDDGAAGVDAISKHIANMYVPGVAIQGLVPVKDRDPGETARLRQAVMALAGGVENGDIAPGTLNRVPQAARDRIAAALRVATTFEALGEERVTPMHFTVDPNLARNRWYRLATPDGFRYLTVRLNGAGKLLGALLETD